MENGRRQSLEQSVITYHTAGAHHVVALECLTVEGRKVFGLVLQVAVNDGYVFVNWTEDDVEVSTETSYTFTITGSHNFVANFEFLGLLGDVNNDNIINIADVQGVATYLYYGDDIPLPWFNKVNADANQDGIIDVSDIQAILNIIHNIFPNKSNATGLALLNIKLKLCLVLFANLKTKFLIFSSVIKSKSASEGEPKTLIIF